MRISSALMALAATAFLSACNSEEVCTEEQLKQKFIELNAKMGDIAATDPARLAEIASKMEEFVTKAQAQGDDLQATCKAMDEMIVELNK